MGEGGHWRAALPLTITLHGSTYSRLRGRNRVVFRGMSTHDDEDDVGPDELAEYRICSGCIGEKFLQVDVENTGETQDCSYCGKSGRTLSVGDLAKAVEVALDEHYYQTPGEGNQCSLSRPRFFIVRETHRCVEASRFGTWASTVTVSVGRAHECAWHRGLLWSH